MTRWTTRPWFSVEDAAQLLRVNRKTLYAAIAEDDFPHLRVGPYIRIPAEALLLTPRPDTNSRTYHINDDAYQYALDLGPIVPVKRYRNGDIKKVGDYETSLSSRRTWRNPPERP